MELKKTDTFIEHDIIVDNTNVGTVELCPERHEISRLVIFEPYQNKGYGTQVVQSLVKQGYTSLWVRSDNPRAIHVYEKCGFIKGETTMLEMVYNPTDETSTVEPIANSNYIKYEDAIEAIKTLQIKDDNRQLYNEKRNLLAMDADRPANKVIESLPSADRPNEVIYGNEHNCIMTIFGECSYAETGCGDCAVVEKVRKALSSDRPQGVWLETTDGEHFCSACHKDAIYNATFEEILSDFCPNCGCRMKGVDNGRYDKEK